MNKKFKEFINIKHWGPQCFLFDKMKKNDIIDTIKNLGGIIMYGGQILTPKDINNINALIDNAKILWDYLPRISKIRVYGKEKYNSVPKYNRSDTKVIRL